MKIALYGSHYNLPSWQAPTQPLEMFGSEMGDRPIEIGNGRVPLRNTLLWPVLRGLDLVESGTLAHVAAMMPTRDGRSWKIPEHVRMIVTDCPEETDEWGIPQVARDRNPLVRLLWEDAANEVGNRLRGAHSVIVEEDICAPFRWYFFFDERLRKPTGPPA